jgi:D-arabinitol dehydrogenase (NADP+)
MMHAVTVNGPGRVQVVEMPRPVPADGQILVKVGACGVCGTDVHIVRGEYLGDYPVIPGHEFAGEVVEVGPGVTAFKRHDRVAVEPNLSCGHCRFCRLNEQNFCEHWQAIGVTLPGAMAEYVVVPAHAAFDIGSMPDDAAAFMEPLSCVLHGMQKLDVRYGETVLILGAGPIGMLLMQVAIGCGAARVVVADRVASRLELAGGLGASEVVNTADGFDELADRAPGGYDAVVDATGVPAVMEQTLRLARRGGRVLWFGVAPNDAAISLQPFEVFRKGLSILSSYTSLRNSRAALELIHTGRVTVGPLVSHRLPLPGFEQAVELLSNPDTAMKIQIVPGG